MRKFILLVYVSFSLSAVAQTNTTAARHAALVEFGKHCKAEFDKFQGCTVIATKLPVEPYPGFVFQPLAYVKSNTPATNVTLRIISEYEKERLTGELFIVCDSKTFEFSTWRRKVSGLPGAGYREQLDIELSQADFRQMALASSVEIKIGKFAFPVEKKSRESWRAFSRYLDQAAMK